MTRIDAKARHLILRKQATAVVAVLLATAVLVLAPHVATAQEAPTADAAEVGTPDWAQVSAGAFHTCGIRTSGRLYCWGYDAYGQLGDGGPNAGQSTPVEVFGGGTNWTSVAVGQSHTCARRASGRLFCWGRDNTGQVGDGPPNVDQATPVEVFGGGTTWTAVTAGTDHTCARRASGRLFCWGGDLFGQLGDGPGNTSQPAPVQVAGGAANWTSVSAGSFHTCGRRATGRLYCWGADYHGQLGDGSPPVAQYAPVQVAGSATNWAAVSAGGTLTCGRRTSGALLCWGSDFWGQLGNGGANTDRNAPVPVLGGTTWTTVTAGDGFACGLRASGRLYCWGLDFFGQLGNGAPNAERHAPVQVAGGATSWTGVVDAGGNHVCARRASGRLFCWGRDIEGELGDGGANTDQSAPAQVA